MLSDGVIRDGQEEDFSRAASEDESAAAHRPIPSIKSSLRAHPRLVHGFLVRLPKRSTVTSDGTNTRFTSTASGKAQMEFPSDTKHEGPADDATFH